jgi:hypothetical protein
MPAANTLPEKRTLAEILEHWKTTKFTGVAILNIGLGVVGSVEYGRPDRVLINHSEPLEKSDLTARNSP